MLAAWSFSFSRRLSQLGFLLDAVGGGVIVLAVLMQRLRADRLLWLWLLLAAGVLLAAGFVLVILALHWGVNPYSPRG